jgi:hypothetical protein
MICVIINIYMNYEKNLPQHVGISSGDEADEKKN